MLIRNGRVKNFRVKKFMQKVIKYCLIVAILLVTACSLTPSGDYGEDLQGQGTEGNPYQLFLREPLNGNS